MKYELGEEKELYGIKMRRVVALTAIASKGVSPGDVGGWVESEQNLSQASDEAWVSDEAMVFGSATVSDSARVSGSATVSDSARVSGSARVSDEAMVSKTSDLLVIGPIGSRDAYLTIANDYAATECFCGTWEQFAQAVSVTHGSSAHAKEYLAAIEFAKVRFAVSEAQP